MGTQPNQAPSKPKFWSIERTVTVLTPAFAAVSAWVVGVVGTNVPGAPPINASSITALEISAVVAATAAAVKWLHGRQIPGIKDSLNSLDEIIDPIVHKVNELGLTPEIEAVIRAEVSKGIGQIHTPQVEEIVQQVFQRITNAATAAPLPGPAASAETTPTAGA